MKKILLCTLALCYIGHTSLYAENENAYETGNTCEDETSYNDGFYIGVAYASTKVKVDLPKKFTFNLPNETNDYGVLLDEVTDSVLLQMGYDFNEYFGIEGRYYLNNSSIALDYYVNNKFITDKYKAESFALYIKPQYNFSKVTLYGLLGVTKNDYTVSKLLGPKDDTFFSWGLGAKFNFTDSFGIFADYTDLGGDENAFNIKTNLSAWSFGLSYKF